MEKRSTQSRGGVKGESPLRSPEAAPLVGFGATPQLFLVKSIQREKSTEGAGSEASLPVTSRSRRSAPSCFFDLLNIVAPDGRDRPAGEAIRLPAAGLFRCRGFASAEASRGFAVAPDTPSQRTSMLLDFLCCRGILRLRARVGGFAGVPDTPSQRTSMLLDFSCCKGELHLSPSFSGKKFPKGAFPPCAKRKSMLQYARIEAFERAEASAPVRENVFVDNPDEELRKEDFSYAVRLL